MGYYHLSAVLLQSLAIEKERMVVRRFSAFVVLVFLTANLALAPFSFPSPASLLLTSCLRGLLFIFIFFSRLTAAASVSCFGMVPPISNVWTCILPLSGSFCNKSALQAAHHHARIGFHDGPSLPPSLLVLHPSQSWSCAPLSAQRRMVGVKKVNCQCRCTEGAVFHSANSEGFLSFRSTRTLIIKETDVHFVYHAVPAEEEGGGGDPPRGSKLIEHVEVSRIAGFLPLVPGIVGTLFPGWAALSGGRGKHAA